MINSRQIYKTLILSYIHSASNNHPLVFISTKNAHKLSIRNFSLFVCIFIRTLQNTKMWIFKKDQEDKIKDEQKKVAEEQSKIKGVKMDDQQLLAQAKKTITKIIQVNASSAWVKKEDKPCYIYVMKNDDNRLVVKGQAVIKASAKQIQDYVTDEKNYLPDNVAFNKIIKDGPYGELKHRRHKAIWPVDDRDLVLLKTKHYEANRTIIGVRSINYDIPLQKGVIRAQQHIGGFIIEKISDNQCKLTHIADLDFKGSIPSIIKKKISQAQGKMPAKAKQALQKKK